MARKKRRNGRNGGNGTKEDILKKKSPWDPHVVRTALTEFYHGFKDSNYVLFRLPQPFREFEFFFQSCFYRQFMKILLEVDWTISIVIVERGEFGACALILQRVFDPKTWVAEDIGKLRLFWGDLLDDEEGKDEDKCKEPLFYLPDSGRILSSWNKENPQTMEDLASTISRLSDLLSAGVANERGSEDVFARDLNHNCRPNKFCPGPSYVFSHGTKSVKESLHFRLLCSDIVWSARKRAKSCDQSYREIFPFHVVDISAIVQDESVDSGTKGMSQEPSHRIQPIEDMAKVDISNTTKTPGLTKFDAKRESNNSVNGEISNKAKESSEPTAAKSADSKTNNYSSCHYTPPKYDASYLRYSPYTYYTPWRSRHSLYRSSTQVMSTVALPDQLSVTIQKGVIPGVSNLTFDGPLQMSLTFRTESMADSFRNDMEQAKANDNDVQKLDPVPNRKELSEYPGNRQRNWQNLVQEAKDHVTNNQNGASKERIIERPADDTRTVAERMTEYFQSLKLANSDSEDFLINSDLNPDRYGSLDLLEPVVVKLPKLDSNLKEEAAKSCLNAKDFPDKPTLSCTDQQMKTPEDTVAPQNAVEENSAMYTSSNAKSDGLKSLADLKDFYQKQKEKPGRDGDWETANKAASLFFTFAENFLENEIEFRANPIDPREAEPSNKLKGMKKGEKIAWGDLSLESMLPETAHREPFKTLLHEHDLKSRPVPQDLERVTEDTVDSKETTTGAERQGDSGSKKKPANAKRKEKKKEYHRRLKAQKRGEET